MSVSSAARAASGLGSALAAASASAPRALLADSQRALASSVSALLAGRLGASIPTEDIVPFLSRPKAVEHGDLALSCFPLANKLKPSADKFAAAAGTPLTPQALAEFIAREISVENDSSSGLTDLRALLSPPVVAAADASEPAGSPSAAAASSAPLRDIAVTGAFVNTTFSPSLTGRAVYGAVFSDFLHPPAPAAAATAAGTAGPGRPRVVIEYSQPNTHKAFHVGHMRNAALGDSLVRLYEQTGHSVVAANYFGDEGAHVAKCLWYLQKVYLPKAQALASSGATEPAVDATGELVYPLQSVADLDAALPPSAASRAEWLGSLYARAVDALTLGTYSAMPWDGVVAARVVTVGPHPDPEGASKGWHVVRLDFGAPELATVVCAGTGYSEGDWVAYLPVGARLNKKMGTVLPRDMKGVSSEGVMLGVTELPSVGAPSAADDEDDAGAAAVAAAGAAKGKGGKGGKGKKDATSTNTGSDKQIFLLPPPGLPSCAPPLTPGLSLADLGRLPSVPASASSATAHLAALTAEAAAVLRALEAADPAACALWRQTGSWSLDAFKEIYKWLDCRFDHDFTESEVSEPSRKLVQRWLAEGRLQRKDGAVVADLTELGLGTLVLLKSDGAGLYATKDLALAQKKIDMFSPDKSVYVVDAAQTLHFKQVFAALGQCGHPEAAARCSHLSYGQVVLPSGKMSSRKGNVLLFSQLRSTIEKVLNEKYNADGSLPPEAVRRIAVAAIKYGMLNHDTAKDIVFQMDAWTNNTGNTGPYLLYALTRVRAMLAPRAGYEGTKFDIVRALKQRAESKGLSLSDEDVLAFVVPTSADGVSTASDKEAGKRIDLPAFFSSSLPAAQAILSEVDMAAHLSAPSERALLLQLNRFWPVVDAAVAAHNPSPVCDYAFALAQGFSAWYEQVRLTTAPPDTVVARVLLVAAVEATLTKVVGLLGITPVDRM